MKTYILTFVAILYATISLAQTTIRGRVIDATSGNGLIGASVYLEDFNAGSFTDFDGFFQFKARVHGQTNLVAPTMVYSKVKKYISLKGAGVMNLGKMVHEPGAIDLQGTMS